MKNSTIALVLIATLSACGYTKPEAVTAEVVEPSTVEVPVVSNATAQVSDVPPPVYVQAVPTVAGRQSQVARPIICVRVTMRNGKYFCTFVPDSYAESIPSPFGGNEIPFEEVECRSVVITGTVNTCEQK